MKHRLAFLIAIPFVLTAAAIVAARPEPKPAQAPSAVPYHPNGIYAVGDKVGWTVSAFGDKVSYVLKKNNLEVVKSGDLELRNGKAVIEGPSDRPTMLFLQVSLPGGRAVDFGAAVAPEKLVNDVPRPADFDRFWQRKIAELQAIPENAVLTPSESGKEGVDYATLRMDHVNTTHVYGQIAKPSKPGKFPAVLILQWASPPYPLQRSWVVDRAAEGWLALNIEPHDVLPTAPPAYYQGLPDPLKNYAGINQEDLEKNYFVEMYLRGIRAVDYLAGRADWNGKTLLVMGTSMGGQQSLAVSGLHPKVTHMIVNVPAGCDMNASLHGRQLGYPFYPDKNPKAMEVARYFDCTYFASNIKATSLAAMGFVDTACPPAGVWMAFNQIRGPKEVVPLHDSPHNHLATREQQEPINLRTYQWLAALVKGERVDPKPFGKP